MDSSAFDVVLWIVLILATAVWVGGYVAVSVVARVARRTIEPAQRVVFFRALGQAFGIVSGVALALALGSAAVLVAEQEWEGLLTAAAIASAALVAATLLGVAQARRMTRLRRDALTRPEDSVLTDRLSRGARDARLLRSLIGVLSLALVGLGVLIAT